ncbi:septum formation initiator family protein [Erythrobacter sp.]|uniref:FtsB family cell division protein n=1 Tax=Erythrobacter sp. TaxID=1042 RepID=UPI00342113D4
MTGQEFITGYSERPQVALPNNPLRLWAALFVLLALAGLAIIGPWGVLAWYENSAVLDQRQDKITILKEEISALQNRVDLLDPESVDSDLAGELARRDLGVLHPDEVVITLPED